jgi:hypothetical protein
VKKPAKTERWRPAVGYANYEVSDHGRVRWLGQPGVPPCIKTFSVDKDGYLEVKLNIKGQRIRRRVNVLVLEAFHGLRPARTETRHLDGVKKNNRLTNLKWGTPKENADDRRLHGTESRGSKKHNAKLTEEDIPKIRASRAAGIAIREIARQRGVHYTTIAQIFSKRKAWKHVLTT